jgi:hydrophobic/amphiphilic exporter-1 (mainly G- bacteria), HAE1 family
MLKFIVDHPATLLTIFILLVLFGVYTCSNLATDLYPEINPPILILYTSYTGAGPEEVEKSITRPLEGVMSNVGKIDKITSTSSEGTSFIQIAFVYGTNMDEATNDVRDKLELAKNYLPEDADSPQIFKFDPSMIPILQLVVNGDRSQEELKEIAENVIVPRLEQTDGVSLASVIGGRARLVRVEIPQNRLEAYNLTLTQIAQSLRGQNVQVSAGSITEGQKNFLIRTSGEYESLKEIRNTVITYKPVPSSSRDLNPRLVPIRLRDLGEVFDGYEDANAKVYIDGKPGIYVSVQKQSGSNSVKAADAVIAKLPSINSTLPRGISVSVLMDVTKIIRNSLSQVTSSLTLGIILVVLVLFLFLRSMRPTLIISLSIPISVIITLTLMYFFNLTLNLMTLAGLALGIGMLVDNSIVILENTYRHREKGAKLRVAAVLGGHEMLLPIVASTLTTIVVFAPVALYKNQLGFMGDMFSSLSFTVVISLTMSLVVAIFLIPILASKYIPIASRKEQPLTGVLKKADDIISGLLERLNTAYKKALHWLLHRRKLALLTAAGLFAITLVLIVLRGLELLPSFEDDHINVSVELPAGTKLEATELILNQLQEIVKTEIKGYTNLVLTVGQQSFFRMGGGNQSNQGSLQISLPEFKKRIDTVDSIKEKLRKHMQDFPSAKIYFGGGFGGRMMGTGSPVDILIQSNDLVKGKKTAETIRDLIKDQLKFVTEPTIDLADGLPQVDIIIDRDKAYDLGLNIYSIGQEIKANLDGITASRFKEGGTEYDILVILKKEDRDSMPDLQNQKIFVTNTKGNRIPLSSFARLEKSTGPVSIKREKQGRTIHLTAGVIPGTDIRNTQDQIKKLITENIPADNDVLIDFSGDWANLMKYGIQLLLILLISILLVFGIMASQFESFLDPFIIMFTMPLTIIGVLLIHVILNLNFSLFTVVGTIVLMGVVVNNGIILVDYTNLLRKRGMELFEACAEAGRTRLRPVLMTTLTTVLGLLPLAFDKGEGIDLIRPIGLTILGGLTVSTFFTLFLIPVIYSIFHQRKDRWIERRAETMKARYEMRKLTMQKKGANS